MVPGDRGSVVSFDADGGGGDFFHDELSYVYCSIGPRSTMQSLRCGSRPYDSSTRCPVALAPSSCLHTCPRIGVGILCLRLHRSFGFRLAVLLPVGQNFEGINYGDRKLRDQMRAGFVDIGRRERKPAAVKAYAPPPIRAGEALIFLTVPPC